MPQLNIPKKQFVCANCGKVIEVPFGIGKPTHCPHCGAPQALIHRLNPGPPGGRGGWGGGGWRGGRGRGSCWRWLLNLFTGQKQQ